MKQSLNICKGEITVQKQPINYRLLFSLGIVFLLFTISFTAYSESDDFELAASNEYLNLYINPTTTEVAIEDKATQKFWYTNPQERHNQKGLAFERLSSQFTIIHDPKQVEKENYRFSTEYDQFDIVAIDNGVRVNYTIVEKWDPEHYVPHMIRKDRMEELILSGIETEKELKQVLDVYYLIMLAPLGDNQRIDVPGLDQDKIFGEYDVHILNEDYQARESQLKELGQEVDSFPQGTPERTDLESKISQLQRQQNKDKENAIWQLIYTIVDYRLDIEKMNYITHDDVSQLINTPTYLMDKVPRFTLKSIQSIIVQTGYTPIECGEDHEMNNLNPLLANLQTFSIPLEYVLDGPNLLVRIPAKDIKYPIEVEDLIGDKYTFPLLSIRLLEYFGAAGKDHEGYMLVPDGSGALIYLNNDRLSASGYNELVYGVDNACNTIKEVRRFPEPIRLPVFGLKQDDQAIFAIIEEGASLARIKADISGRINDYNRVFAEFSPIASASVSLSVESDNVSFSGSVPTYQARMYEGDFVVRYSFLSGDNANYMGMANYYRDYLISKYKLEPMVYQDNIPFYLELVGAIDKREPILGIARDVIHPLTSFQQAKTILQDLSGQGIDNIKLKYSGWLSGGLNHDYPIKASVEKVLGKVDELQSLSDYMDAYGYELYPSVGFLNVYRNTIFNSFNARTDASRLLNRLVARGYRYRLDVFEMSGSHTSYVLSPRTLDRVVDGFLDNYQKLNLANISLFDMAAEVNSDFIDDVKKMVDREQAVSIIEQQFRKMQDMGLKIMVDNGNSYAIPYADSIINMPTSGSSYHIVDEEIPFYQIVIHGLISYAGKPINLSASIQDDLLRMLEIGGYPYFIGSFEDSSEVKNTRYAYLYALHYDDWMESAAEIYQTANQVLRDVQAEQIVDHKRLMNNVYQTTYESGKSIIVNYNWEPVQVYHRVIEGKDFTVMEGIDYED